MNAACVRFEEKEIQLKPSSAGFFPTHSGLTAGGLLSNTRAARRRSCWSRDDRKFLLRRLSRVISSTSIIFKHDSCHVTHRRPNRAVFAGQPDLRSRSSDSPAAHLQSAKSCCTVTISLMYCRCEASSTASLYWVVKKSGHFRLVYLHNIT